MGNGPQLLWQPIEHTPHVEAKFQGWAEIVSNHKVHVKSGNIFNRVSIGLPILCKAQRLRASGLSGCQDAGVISHHTVHEALPATARRVKPGQASQAIEGQILPQIIPIICGESKAGL
jgi:methylaspartate ammonia-lyase